MASINTKSVFVAETERITLELIDVPRASLKGLTVIKQEEYVRPEKLPRGLYVIPERWKILRAEYQDKSEKDKKVEKISPSKLKKKKSKSCKRK